MSLFGLVDFKCLDVTWDVDPQDYTGGQVIFENKKQGMVKAGIATPYRIVLDDLRAKEYTMKVRVKNDSGGYIKKNTGEYKDKAYDWRKNPGGWYMKICFGGKCDDFTNNITWKRAGPHFSWAGYSFLNDYAVIPELDPDIGTTHTETWTFVVPESTNYQFQTAMDNTGTILLQKFNAGNWNTVKTVTNSGLSGNTQTFFLKEGLYRIQASVTNASNNIPLKFETWDNNPAGIAFNLTRVAEISNISATLDSNANLVVTGTGRAEIKMELVYDDNPKTEGTGLGTYKVAGMKFVRDLKKKKVISQHLLLLHLKRIGKLFVEMMVGLKLEVEIRSASLIEVEMIVMSLLELRIDLYHYQIQTMQSSHLWT